MNMTRCLKETFRSSGAGLIRAGLKEGNGLSGLLSTLSRLATGTEVSLGKGNL